MSQMFSFLFCYFVIITDAKVILFLKKQAFHEIFFLIFFSSSWLMSSFVIETVYIKEI